jgi:hypothetical protein
MSPTDCGASLCVIKKLVNEEAMVRSWAAEPRKQTDAHRYLYIFIYICSNLCKVEISSTKYIYSNFLFYTYGIQPDEGYFVVAETCGCSLQLLHRGCALTGCKPQTRYNTECKFQYRSIARVWTVTSDITPVSIKAQISVHPLQFPV